MDKEIWKDIPGYEGFYKINNYGKVKSLVIPIYRMNKFAYYTKERILKPYVSNKGYYLIDLMKNTVRKKYTIHSLVAAVFIGKRQKGMCVCHNDNNRKNNYYKNLRYDTYKGNESDKIKHNTIVRGSKCYNSVLNELQVRIIKRLLDFGTITQRDRRIFWG